MDQQTCIIIADDHPLFRSALSGTLHRAIPSAHIIEAADLTSLQNCVEQHTKAQLILLDLHMPGAEGFGGLIFLLAHYPHIPVMIVSAHDDSDIIRRAIDHGAAGFLPKSSSLESMNEAIHTVLSGGIWTPPNILANSAINESETDIAAALGTLTPQQFRVANMVTQGLLNKQIAFELNVTEATIKAHMTEIFRKLKLNTRTQLVMALSQLSIKPAHDDQNFKPS